ncbi:MAG: ROK family protein [Proteobacteria bacterium]|nr:ROK family protein [Pseudomonadota bacterium]
MTESAEKLGGHLWYGVDVGGTKIELVACNDALQILHRQRVATPTQDYPAFLDAITSLVTNADAELGRQCDAIGIGLPGVIDRESGLGFSANIPAINGKPVAGDFRAYLQRPTCIGNDLQCFAISEANGGAAAGYPTMIGAILGTGAGGGYCVDGRVVAGFNGLGVEWGHWSVPAALVVKYGLPIHECACGLTGCIECYVSGTGLARLHRHLGGDAADAGGVIAAVQSGDDAARRALEIHLDLLGHALADVIKAFDPHAIVLGGGLSKLESIYRDLPAAIAVHLFRNTKVPPILPPLFGDAGGARGAALLARQHGA